MADKVKVMLKNVRASYVTLEEPRAIVEDGEKYYSVSIIIEKTNPALSEIKKFIDEATLRNKWTGKIDKAVRKGDEERPEDEAYEGKLFVNAKSRRQPLIINGKREQIPASEIYSGCFVNAQIQLYEYNKAGNKGVGVGLLAVQFLRDGEPLGSAVDVNDFDEFEVEEESTTDDDMFA